MSDGGAQLIVEVGEALSRNRLGRIVMALVTVFMMLSALYSGVAGDDGGVMFCLAIGSVSGVLVAVGVLRDETNRAGRASVKLVGAALLLFGIMIVAGIVLLVRRRKRGAAEKLEKIDAAEVDRLAQEAV